MIKAGKEAEVSFQDKNFVIGGLVLANGKSDYEGLFGCVRSIHCHGGQGYGNGRAYVCCAFQLPEGPQVVYNLERRFTKLYGRQAGLEDIPLDAVVLSAEMVEPVAQILPETEQSLYVLTLLKEYTYGAFSTPLGASEDIGILLRLMQEDKNKYVPLVLTSSVVRETGICFSYEAKDVLKDDECVYTYVISTAALYPTSGVPESGDAL